MTILVLDLLTPKKLIISRFIDKKTQENKRNLNIKNSCLSRDK